MLASMITATWPKKIIWFNLTAEKLQKDLLYGACGQVVYSNVIGC